MENNTFTELSEKYRKYLIQINYKKLSYYSVFGADLTKEEIDRLLIDKKGRLVLAYSMPNLVQFVKSCDWHSFDEENFHKWLLHINSGSIYTSFNLDSLIFYGERNKKELSDLYNLLGLLDDYSFQTDDNSLSSLLSRIEIQEFKDKMADATLWGINEKVYFNPTLNKVFKDIYESLRLRLV